MKESFLHQAKENDHTMLLFAPGQYECRDCSASIKQDQSGCGNQWDASKILLQCPGAQDVPVPDSFSNIPKRIA